MQRFKNILVVLGHVTTGTRHAALERAASLARNHRSGLRLVSVVEDLPRLTRWLLRSADELLEIVENDRLGRLEALAAPLRAEGIEVTTQVLRGRPGTEIVREVLRNQHDLLLKEGEIDGEWLVGSTDWHLLRDCPCPVFLVKPSQETRPFRRILVAVDPSPIPEESDVLSVESLEDARVRKALNVRIMELARGLAEEEQAELDVLHAWHVPGEVLLRGETFVPQKQVDEYVESMQAEARRAFDAFLAEFPPAKTPTHVHFIKGTPAEVIVHFARANQVDLIVMGTVARTGIPGFVIGNTAESSLRRVECSVLTVKPEGFVSAVTLDEKR